MQLAVCFEWTNKYKDFAALILTELPSNLEISACRKTFFSFKLTIHDFHEQNNHLDNLTLNVANIGIDVIIIGVTQQQIQSFYFLTNSHRASQLVAKNHSAETTSQKGIFTSLWLVGYHSS